MLIMSLCSIVMLSAAMVSFAFFNCYADFDQFHSFIVMLSVMMLSAVMVSDAFSNVMLIMLSGTFFIVMLSVIMLSVVAPIKAFNAFSNITSRSYKTFHPYLMSLL